jgi:MtaA/CmuA family methyltransferase
MPREQMTSYERVSAAFRRLPYDRIPLINPVSNVIRESMVKTGCFFPQAHYDAAKMALLAAAGHDLFGFDSVSPYFSACNEAAAFGCVINWGSVDLPPSIRSNIKYNELNIKPNDEYISKKPVKTIVDAIRLLKAKYNDKVVIIGKVIGPWTLAFNLFGTQKMLTNLILNMESVIELTGQLNEYILEFAKAQIEAGAHIITISDDAVGDFLSLDGYHILIQPLHQMINKLIHIAGAFSIIHLNGVAIDKLVDFADAGFDGANIDSYNQFLTAKKIVGDRLIYCGGLNVPQVLLSGNIEDVIHEVSYYMKNGIDILAPEEVLNAGVPSENLKAIYTGIYRYYSKNIK